MTPHQTRLAEQASKEMDSMKLLVLVAELCRAIDDEHKENIFRVGCREDCREHLGSPAPVFSPQLVQYGRRSAFTVRAAGEETWRAPAGRRRLTKISDTKVSPSIL